MVPSVVPFGGVSWSVCLGVLSGGHVLSQVWRQRRLLWITDSQDPRPTGLYLEPDLVTNVLTPQSLPTVCFAQSSL
eukprot:6462856-Amphidinium_carterae.1